MDITPCQVEHMSQEARVPRKPANRVPNERLIAARKERGLKITHCARELETYAQESLDERYQGWNCPPERYKGWEDGRIPHVDAWPVLIGFFALTPAELGIQADPSPVCTSPPLLATVVGTPQTTLDPEPVTQRREFLSATLAATLPAGQPPTRVEMRHVRELTASLRAIRDADQLHGGGSLTTAAERLLRRGQQMLGGAYTDLVGRQLHSAIGLINVQTGWLSFDAGRMEQAAAHYRDALVAASVSRDDAVEVHALANYAYYSEESGRPREAICHLRAARDTADRWAHPALRSLLLSREAAQWAAIGDLAAFQRLSDEAHDIYEAAPADAWYSFVDQGELFAMEGYGLAVGGNPNEAVRLFGHAVDDTSPERPRNAASRLLFLARATTAMGDPTGAVIHANRALTALEGVNSGRLRGSLRQLRAKLAAHHNISAVRDFEEKARLHA